MDQKKLTETQKDYGHFKGLKFRDHEWEVNVYQYLDRCVAEGVQFDCLGIQFHDHAYDLFGAREMMKQWYNRYHLPIHITELEVPSDMAPAEMTINHRPWPASNLIWHEPWTEAVQAEWFEKFFWLMYGLDEVKEFSTFSFCDAPRQWGSYVEGYQAAERFKVGAIAHAGLLDEDHRVKPAYYTLKRLMRENGIAKLK